MPNQFVFHKAAIDIEKLHIAFPAGRVGQANRTMQLHIGSLDVNWLGSAIGHGFENAEDPSTPAAFLKTAL